jgi:AcrR family transcriptional regulator
VSSRTFFNYFPSKVSAILGVEGLVITDEARAAFLAGDGERDLVPDLCALVATLGDTVTARQERREALHDLLVRRPELVRDVFFLMTDVRKQVIELAAERTTLERARLATTLVFAATGYAMERAEERPAEDLGVWLLQTVRDMSALVGDSLD